MKARKKILLLRPPSRLWPIINESDNFLLPLGFPCLAAYLRERLPELEIKILDCLPLKIGWKTLRRILAKEQPDFLGVGDMIVYMSEGMHACEIAKEEVPGIITIAGGHFHSHMPEYSLSEFKQLDYIVRWEGEEALYQLLSALWKKDDLNGVGNLAYRNEDGDVVKTAPIPLIDPLDSLPIPAYDIMPIRKYSPFGRLWPRAITVQLGRGCPYACNFCSWTVLEGEHRRIEDKEIMVPTYRAKSVERMLEEIGLLYNKYGVRYLFWVDGTWNLDTDYMDALAEGILSNGYKLGWWAFTRADLLLEQERAGVLEKMVRSGFSHALFGGERPEDSELAWVGKTDMRADSLKEACLLLERKYPSLFRQATFITGIRSETEESMTRIGQYSRECHLDFAAYHPIMPYPGTSLWEKAKENGWIEEWDFSKYDMFYPIMPCERMSRKEVAKETQKLYMHFVMRQPLRYLGGMFSRIRIRRRLHRWFIFSMVRVIALDLWRSLMGRKSFDGFAATSKLWKPKWYNS
ncbi:B12-binding domain-containing radical SAM protein [Thermodesulfobacteriota bacterium]